AEVYSVHSFSVYGRRGLDLGVLGARLGLDFPRYGPRIVSETVSLRLPVKKTSLWVTPAATLEQGSVDAVYFSLSLYCRL
ncbi:MAG: hypothetical protein HY403_08700, partial [Elusimicrobia bacterium]|nr:hypothetical protein [Elusimicrobiota bacterium]